MGGGVGVQAVGLNIGVNTEDVLLLSIISVAITTFVTTDQITVTIIGITTCGRATTILVASPPVPPLPLLLSLAVHISRIVQLLLLGHGGCV